MSSFLWENRRTFDWISRDIVNSAYTQFKKGRLGNTKYQSITLIKQQMLEPTLKFEISVTLSILILVDHCYRQKEEGLFDQPIAIKGTGGRRSLQ